MGFSPLVTNVDNIIYGLILTYFTFPNWKYGPLFLNKGFNLETVFVFKQLNKNKEPKYEGYSIPVKDPKYMAITTGFDWVMLEDYAPLFSNVKFIPYAF